MLGTRRRALLCALCALVCLGWFDWGAREDPEDAAAALERRLAEALGFEQGRAKQAKPRVRVYFLRVIKHKGITLRIPQSGGKATMFFMGRPMFSMTAKHPKAKDNSAAARRAQANTIELKGNHGDDALYLDKARKTLSFRKGKKLDVFAEVSIKESRGRLDVALLRGKPIEMMIWPKPGRAEVRFAGRPFFRMKAKAPSSPVEARLTTADLEGNGSRDAKLSFVEGRRELVFRSGNPSGVFAIVRVAKRMTRRRPGN